MISIFDRLVRLKTAYQLQYRSARSQSGDQSANSGVASRANATSRSGQPPSKGQLFRLLAGQLARRLPIVPARNAHDGYFLATGGALWFESDFGAPQAGRLQASTPECRGAQQVILYQRAQDRLFSSAAEHVEPQDALRLERRADDRSGAGTQEDYETEIASGLTLHAWRIGLVVLLPLAVVTWLAILGLIGAIMGYLFATGFVVLPLLSFLRQPRQVVRQLFGVRSPDLHLPETLACAVPIPPWLDRLVSLAIQVVITPLACGLSVLARLTAFRRARRTLLPFLVSRTILTGSGGVTEEGDCLPADGSGPRNCLLGFEGLWNDRPLFDMSHFLKTAYAEAWFRPRTYFELFRSRQWLRVSLSDTNMADVGELLRVGTTLLVLDALEAGALPSVPRLRRPLNAWRTVAADPTLTASLKTQSARWTALELQRLYCEACHEFLSQRPDAPAEAWLVARLWSDMLTGLETLRDHHDVPMALVGSIDWATKIALFGEHPAATAAERRLLSRQYHELTPDGCFERLQRVGIGTRVVDWSLLDRAMRLAPPDSPATARGHFIREFACAEEPIAANWNRVFIGSGSRTMTHSLHDRSVTGTDRRGPGADAPRRG